MHMFYRQKTETESRINVATNSVKTVNTVHIKKKPKEKRKDAENISKK